MAKNSKIFLGEQTLRSSILYFLRTESQKSSSGYIKCFALSLEDIEGHHVVWARDYSSDTEPQIAGIICVNEDPQEKFYQIARSWSQAYARNKGSIFEDETPRAKQGKLEITTQTPEPVGKPVTNEEFRWFGY